LGSLNICIWEHGELRDALKGGKVNIGDLDHNNITGIKNRAGAERVITVSLPF
jgi:hypothetical protein